MGKYRYTVVDRRGNSGGKNLSNRERFLRRAKEDLQRSVRDGLKDRSITSEDDQNVNIPKDGINEPWLHHDSKSGKNDFILPGNKNFTVGDIIHKPDEGGGAGNEASESGEGNDDFNFQITKDEYYDILFDGLELPDMVKESQKQSVSYKTTRAGFTNVGSPANLDLLGTMRKSIGRRIALKTPKLKEVEKLKEEFEELSKLKTMTDEQILRKKEIQREIDSLCRKTNAISYIDPLDLRFRNYEKQPIPKSQAVMFAIMDVSGSMGQHEKDLAKRFYMLLYLFLQRKYEKIDVVFIRHHSIAQECTEEEFFYSRETGGTVVSTGFDEMLKIQKERYAVDDWNIYVAQASDGDNFSTDNSRLVDIIYNQILPIVQYFSYVEVSAISEQNTFYHGMASQYGLWPIYKKISDDTAHFQMKKVQDMDSVYSIFRELFSKDDNNA